MENAPIGAISRNPCIHVNHLFEAPLCDSQTLIRRTCNVAFHIFTLGLLFLFYHTYAALSSYFFKKLIDKDAPTSDLAHRSLPTIQVKNPIDPDRLEQGPTSVAPEGMEVEASLDEEEFFDCSDIDQADIDQVELEEVAFAETLLHQGERPLAWKYPSLSKSIVGRLCEEKAKLSWIWWSAVQAIQIAKIPEQIESIETFLEEKYLGDKIPTLISFYLKMLDEYEKDKTNRQTQERLLKIAYAISHLSIEQLPPLIEYIDGDLKKEWGGEMINKLSISALLTAIRLMLPKNENQPQLAFLSVDEQATLKKVVISLMLKKHDTVSLLQKTIDHLIFHGHFDSSLEQRYNAIVASSAIFLLKHELCDHLPEYEDNIYQKILALTSVDSYSPFQRLGQLL